MPLKNLIRTSKQQIYLRVSTSKPPPSTVKWYQLDQSCYEDKIQELNTDFAKICISPESSGLLWSRFLFNSLRIGTSGKTEFFHSQFRYYLCQEFLFLSCHFGEVSIYPETLFKTGQGLRSGKVPTLIK